MSIPTRRPARRLVAVAGVAGLALLSTTLPAMSAGAAAPAGKPTPPPTVTGKLLAFNDFHGNIDPPTGSSGVVATTGGNVPAGGVEYLAHWIKQLRAQAQTVTPYVSTVAAGDLVGASPLVSAAFHDEPTVEEMNALGLDVTSVGNHEFDEGVDELLRLQKGGCHPTDGCQDGDAFAGANYPMLAANVVRKSNGKPILPAYKIRKVGGVDVGFVGMTLEGTPSIVNPSGITTVDFLDEVATANRYADALRPRACGPSCCSSTRAEARRFRTTRRRRATTSPARSSTSSRAWTRRMASWSAGTPTSRTCARSRTPRTSRPW